jgi:hypothetical protein
MWTWFGLLGAWDIIYGVGSQITFACGLVFFNVESHFYFSMLSMHYKILFSKPYDKWNEI